MYRAGGLRIPVKKWAKNQDIILNAVELTPVGNPFKLQDETRFPGCFDQMFPHYLIQEKLNNGDGNFSLNKRMLIFRLENNIVVDIIEMTTAIHNRNWQLNNVDCSITTTAIHSTLCEGEDGPWYQHLQSICFNPIAQARLPCEPEPQEPDDEGESSDED
jgi:hypothetical protein